MILVNNLTIFVSERIIVMISVQLLHTSRSSILLNLLQLYTLESAITWYADITTYQLCANYAQLFMNFIISFSFKFCR